MRNHLVSFGFGVTALIKISIAAGLTFALLGIEPTTAMVMAADTSCLTSGPASNQYVVKVCITAPADGATVSGLQTVSAAVTIISTTSKPHVSKLVFYLNGNYLLTDFQNPYGFVLPTTEWSDGDQTLQVEAVINDGFVSQRASVTLNFKNGANATPVNANAFSATSGRTPAPGQPFLVAAVGDGAGGEKNEVNVTNLIASWNPNLLLYLGDVYEKGSSTEFFNWYGPLNSGTLFERFRSITDPVVGNHEYLSDPTASGYFNYWNNIPSYYSYNAGGWHFIALNSNCSLLHICAAGKAEYQWLQQDLAAHKNECTIAYYHHPVFNVGPEGSAKSMIPIWSLLAQYGVLIVLNGHDHDYQRWTPLDGNGNPSPTGITEFVVGSGGHGIQTFVNTDNRMVVGSDTSPDTFGALQLRLSPAGADYQYINYLGAVLDSGTIPCSAAKSTITPTATATTAPAEVTATTAVAAVTPIVPNTDSPASSQPQSAYGINLFRLIALVLFGAFLLAALIIIFVRVRSGDSRKA
jgi:hypothetical protein